MYLSVADITNPVLFVCCRTWICLDITAFMRYSGFAWPPCPKHGKSGLSLLGARGFDTICTADCENRCHSFTTCRRCRLKHEKTLHCLTYRYLLHNMYLSVADITNPVLFVCCRTWICLDITAFMRYSGFAWPPCPKHGKSGLSLLGARGFRHNLHSRLRKPLSQLHHL